MRNKVGLSLVLLGPRHTYIYTSLRTTDAEECYSQILNSLRDVNVPPPSGSSSAVVNTSGRKFIEQYLVAEVERECVLLLANLSGD